MSEFKLYQRRKIAEMRPYVQGEDMTGILISSADSFNGSPRAGDMIARNLNNHDDQWLVSEEYFVDNFGEVID